MKYALKLALIAFLTVGGQSRIVFASDAKADGKELNVERFVDCILIAEGVHSRFPYGVKSVPCNGTTACRQVAINSVRNNLKRWHKAGEPDSFIDFMANRWIPSGSDWQGHINWIENMEGCYGLA